MSNLLMSAMCCSFKNLKMAKELGIATVLIGGETAVEENVTRLATPSLGDQ